ncbi:hypothetical protein [Helicobacter winghamensis]|uniref:Uncharacterized protein n=1 Tax=Helicobacter winghamensis TaxID=157268 RepID=A0A2N3PJK4_9HELI|nr:hypothetical protein [Helicobacter winghamensis]PKT77211.1 hypothetical protein BCM32_02355 [Helicobacter winghamensis]PKT81376.1 hypothetical protein BCM31_06825 [Helicobacter winghamensis]PKT81554.1 hypothetical protein BCM33_01750 [Helicobacter winghamensis]
MKKSITLDVFDEKGASLGKKRFYTTLDKHKSLNQWWVNFKDSADEMLGLISNYPSDFQNQQKVCLLSKPLARYCLNITENNLIPFSVYFSVRHCIPHTWINHNDQFLNPNKKWEKDTEFHSDCLIFMLFHGKNRITAREGINHFIPFSEKELNATEAFESHFMHDFLQGKIKLDSKNTNSKSLFNDELESSFIPTKPLEFSDEAKEVLQAGKELFKHYHEQTRDSKDYNPNAALYDIKAHFQGFNDKGKMNPPQKAKDEAYKQKLGELNYALKNLAKRIESKVYEYEFLLS